MQCHSPNEEEDMSVIDITRHSDTHTDTVSPDTLPRYRGGAWRAEGGAWRGRGRYLSIMGGANGRLSKLSQHLCLQDKSLEREYKCVLINNFYGETCTGNINVANRFIGIFLVNWHLKKFFLITCFLRCRIRI